MFVPPHVHTDYSNYGMYDSVNRIESIIKQLKNLGQTAWAITDHNTCSGIVDAYKQSKKAGIKLIPGAELYLTHDLTIQQRDLRHITFWAKTNEGLENLYKLTSEAHGDKGNSPNNYYYKSRVDLDLIRKYSRGLMVGSACLGGFINSSTGEETLVKLHEIFHDDIFLELHTYQCEEQYVYNRRLIELSRRYDIPLIAATDAHFSVKSDCDLREYFKNTSKTQDASENIDRTLYLQSEDEIRENLNYLPSDIVWQSLANTQLLSDKSDVTIEFGKKYYPVYPCDDPVEEVKKQCRVGWRKKGISKYPNWQDYADRFNKVEMPVIISQDYPSYFLITSDLYKYGRENNIPFGPGRGSVVASEVAWLMGITQLDPLKNNLVFERFAHMERLSPPDIDNDLSRKHRGKLIDYIKSKYGEVYQCRTFSTIAAGKAIGIAGKALGYDSQYTIQLSKSLTKYESDEEDISSYEQKIWMLDHIKTDETAELIELAKRFIGIISGYSKHASALIVLNEDINKFCSVERQVESKTGNVNYVAACNFKYLEEMGLMKLDMLGLKTLDVIQETINLLDTPIDILKIPDDDKKTSQMLINGETCGCFQISSQGMTQLVKQIKPKEFSDLIPLVALFRPGPLDAKVEETGDTMVQTYVKVRNGEIEPVYLHPKLEPILRDTYSIILYQEQILQIAKELCGYSLGEADVLRRIIGKKKIDEMKPAIDQLISRGVANGIPEDVMNKISDRIVTFALYGFNKGHSAAYGLVAYQTSYLKAHYPLQFLCATINSEENSQDAIVPYINEVKRLGVKILPPDIRKGNIEWVIEEGNLRTGLYYIKGIGKKLKISDIDTFDVLVKNNAKDTLAALVKSGACDFYEIPRYQMLVQAYNIPDDRAKTMSKLTSNSQRIEELKLELLNTKKTLKKYKTIESQIANREKDNCRLQKKLDELKQLEISLEKFDEAKGEIEVLGFSSRALPKVKTGTITRIFIKDDKKGRPMAFLTWSTDYGEIKTTVFASQWRKWKSIVKQGSQYKFVDSKGLLEDIKAL